MPAPVNDLPASASTGRPALPACGDVACPRCGAAFHCGAREPGPCACDAVGLTDAQRGALAARHVGCLCPACLRAVADGAPA